MYAEKKEKIYIAIISFMLLGSVILAILGHKLLLLNYGKLFESQDITWSDPQTGYVQTDEGWMYRLNEDKEAVILGFESSETVVILPTYVDGYIVTEIWESAFMYSNIEKVEISNSIVKIGNWAFAGCKNLTSVVLPESVVEIHEFSFMECNENLVFVVEENSYAANFMREQKMNYIYNADSK